MSLTALFKDYITAYAAKDIDTMTQQFADTIHLRDWKISVQGKENALAETRKNFHNANTIDIEILSLTESDQSVAGELKIVVDQHEILHVVDVLDFDPAGKITAIRAYLGRAD